MEGPLALTGTLGQMLYPMIGGRILGDPPDQAGKWTLRRLSPQRDTELR